METILDPTAAPSLSDRVRSFWEKAACGTDERITGELAPLSPEWFARTESHRYAAEPFIHGVAQFTCHRGAKIIEIGVGAGTDHLQWARAGCVCTGVDLTDTAIAATRAHLAIHGLSSDLHRLNAERLPFDDNSFDVAWSWGVIHHAEHPDRVIAEIHRVLKPGGVFLGMMYRRWSLVTLMLWVRYGLLTGRPWRSLTDVTWNHLESVGTKAYTLGELRRLFGAFKPVDVEPILTPYDIRYLPRWLGRFVPPAAGFFIAIRARKTSS